MAAIAAGDGRELWRFGSNGQIMNAVGGKCMSLKDNVVADGGQVALADCDAAAGSKDGRSQWALQENSQLTSGRPGQYCLSQRGSAPGVENVAAKAAAMASSNVNTIAHGTGVVVCNNVSGSTQSYICRGKHGRRRQGCNVLGKQA